MYLQCILSDLKEGKFYFIRATAKGAKRATTASAAIAGAAALPRRASVGASPTKSREKLARAAMVASAAGAFRASRSSSSPLSSSSSSLSSSSSSAGGGGGGGPPGPGSPGYRGGVGSGGKSKLRHLHLRRTSMGGGSFDRMLGI